MAHPSFYIWDTQKTAHGPLDLTTLVAWAQERRITGDTWVFVPKVAAWQRAAQVPELLTFFPLSARSPMPMSPSHPGEPIEGLDTRVLRRLKILAEMTEDQLVRFMDFCEIMQVPVWATIVKQGDNGDAMYLVVEGELSVRLQVHGVVAILAKLGMGDFFGDMSLFDHGPRAADVVADTSAVLLRISTGAFTALAQDAPEVATPFLMAIGRTLVGRVRAANKHHAEAVSFAHIAS